MEDQLGDDCVGRVINTSRERGTANTVKKDPMSSQKKIKKLSSRIMKNCFYNNGENKGLGEKGEKPAGFGSGDAKGNLGSGKKLKPVGGKRTCSKLASDFINNKLRSGNRFGEVGKDGSKTDRTTGMRDTA